MPIGTWFTSLFGRRQGTPHAQHAPGVMTPYESIVDDGPPIGKRLFRPLVYCFEHKVLPSAHFTNHPELQAALLESQTLGASFLHMWSKSAVMCESHRFWPEDTLENDAEGYLRYVRPLVDAVVCVPTRAADSLVWTIRTPKPLTPGETYFVALCKRPGDLCTYFSPSPGHRYFTLEATFESDRACLCEWTQDGTHKNYGSAPLQTSDGFTAMVMSRLAQSF